MAFCMVIIDDELSILHLYQMKFEAAGFTVYTALSGNDGLKLVREKQPDIVLLDIRMPHMSGDEVMARMRAEDWGAEIPVVILTNLGREEAPLSLRFLGVSRYIVKANHTPQQVVDTVHEVLGIRS